jgi:hypothetical protein
MSIIKNVILMCVVLMTIGLVSAGEIVKEDHGTVFIYGTVEDTVRMSGVNNEIFDYNKTVCVNATVIEGEIKIIGSGEYDLEYVFIADLTDVDYISRTVELKQEIISTSWLTGIKLNRTCKLDGVLVGNYQTTHNRLLSIKQNTFYWCLIDQEIRFGDDVIENESLAFTQLNYQDQQDYIPEQLIVKKKCAEHKYISVGSASYSAGSLRLTGITGWAYNAIGNIKLWNIGKAIQGLIFLPLAIIQSTFDFIFSFLFLIINNWWYALLLLEIFCIIPALTHQDYPSMIGTYISMHAKIFDFMYHKVILPAVELIMRIIEVIRNIFRI